MHPSLRKAAVLIDSLDAESAGTLLAQMEPARAEQLRAAVEGLGPIAADERARIVAEFRRGARGASGAVGGVELAGSLAQRFGGAERGAQGHAAEQQIGTRCDDGVMAGSRVGSGRGVGAGSAADARGGAAGATTSAAGAPFRFLHAADTASLVRFLSHEHPQTIALVLSHLAPGQAGEVLQRLAVPLRGDVIRRLAVLREASPQAVAEVERALELRLSSLPAGERLPVAGLSAARQILAAVDRHVCDEIVGQLEGSDPHLATALSAARPRRRPVEWDDLARMSDGDLRRVVQFAGDELLVPALAAAEPYLLERVLAVLPAARVPRLRYAMAHLGPTRLSDLEVAGQQLLDLVSDLEAQEQVRVVRTSERLSAAA